jgi:hypothetical protein
MLWNICLTRPDVESLCNGPPGPENAGRNLAFRPSDLLLLGCEANIAGLLIRLAIKAYPRSLSSLQNLPFLVQAFWKSPRIAILIILLAPLSWRRSQTLQSGVVRFGQPKAELCLNCATVLMQILDLTDRYKYGAKFRLEESQMGAEVWMYASSLHREGWSYCHRK